MDKRIEKVVKAITVGMIVVGVIISVANFVPRSYAFEWTYGTVYRNYCSPSDPCWLGTGLCCLGNPSNCTYNPNP